MNTSLEESVGLEIYPTDDGLLAIERANDIVLLLSSDQLLAVIEKLRSYYDTRNQWREPTPG